MTTNQFLAGADTTRLTVVVSDDTARQQAAARRALSQEALARFPAAADGDQAALLAARQWRDDMYAALGLNVPATETPAPVSPRPPVKPTQPRVIVRIRNRDNDEDWRGRGACRDVDPETFFPIGDSGPAVLQVEQAKAVCRRCDVQEKCLQWALDAGQDSGVWGGMSEVERRAHKQIRKAVAA